MKVLITGAAGYIGSHTAVEFLNAGYDIVSVDNYCNSSPLSLERVKQISGRDFEIFDCDIRDTDKLSGIFERTRPEAVIHFAGLKAVGESCSLPLEYYDNNIGGTISLLKAMRANGVKTIVFSSSATVYGSANEPPLVETMPVGGTTNPYGTTKLYIERILQDLAAADPEWSVAILRYFNPIGAHDSGMIGEAPNGIPNNLMPYVTQVACGRRERLNVFGGDYDTPDGTCIRDYIHVVDLALGHVKAVEKCSGEKGVVICNLGTGVGYSVLDVIKTFEEASGVTIPYAIVGRREGDLARLYSDCSKAKGVLGWTAKRDLYDMCRTSWNWQKNNPNGYES